MNKKTKALLYNFLGFAPAFLIIYFLAQHYSRFDSIWNAFIAFVVSTIIAPKFQAVTIQGEEKLFMKWIFMKGIKEIK